LVTIEEPGGDEMGKTKWQEKNVSYISKYKAGAKRKTDVRNDDDGSVGGHQVEHYDGSVDAVITPTTVGVKTRTMEEN
jgi:hypothetical protein